MKRLEFSLVDPSKGVLNISEVNETYVLSYPCSSVIDCTPYKTTLSPGSYYVELYGASGGSYMPTYPLRYENNTFLDESIVNFYKGNAHKAQDSGSVVFISKWISRYK